ncbi:MAG TPA: hypothetical protein PLR71_14595 [Deltaproteobacteria bacterium]|nr:hypothetical protein [Deltaproteobacteria bacterium]HQI82774.1 hypothetical protein [Deltaproteobacteria bacterium]
MTGKKLCSPCVLLVALACFLCLVLTGCEGSESRKTVIDTIGEAAGKKVVEQGEKIKRDINQEMKEEAKRILRMGEQDKGGSSQEQSGQEQDEARDQ